MAEQKGINVEDEAERVEAKKQKAWKRKTKKWCSEQSRLTWGKRIKVITLRFLKYGNTEPVGLSIDEISKIVTEKRQTVRSVCQAYVRRGGRVPLNFQDRTKYKKKLSEGQRQWVCSSKVLSEHSVLPLNSRCYILQQLFGVRVTRWTLRNYYKEYKISYKVPKWGFATKYTEVSSGYKA